MTAGISPKVLIPLVAGVLVGLVLLVVWLVAGQDDEVLLTTALSVLGTALAAAGLGYSAPPGDVVAEYGPPSDTMLPPEPANDTMHPPEART